MLALIVVTDELADIITEWCDRLSAESKYPKPRILTWEDAVVHSLKLYPGISFRLDTFGGNLALKIEYQDTRGRGSYRTLEIDGLTYRRVRKNVSELMNRFYWGKEGTTQED